MNDKRNGFRQFWVSVTDSRLFERGVSSDVRDSERTLPVDVLWQAGNYSLHGRDLRGVGVWFRRRVLSVAALLVVAPMLLSGSGAAASSGGQGLVTTTPAASSDVSSLTWALYRPVISLDPIQAFDYPENSVISVLCDAIQRQEPDGSVGPGLATLTYKTPLEIVLNIHPGVRFWDGSLLTSADVMYSLERNINPKYGGFYGPAFNRVKSITATGPLTVKIALTQPDYWLQGELSNMPGIVIERKYALAHPSNYGTPAGGAMCTGPYKVAHWTPGGSVTVVRNTDYWDRALKVRAKQIVFEGVSDATALASGLLTGEIDGTYLYDTSVLPELSRASNLHVYLGASSVTDFFVPLNLKGVLGDVRVRQALSLAFDRTSYIRANYDRAAQLPRLASNPGTWGYARNVFQAAWNSAPKLQHNLARAKALIKAAGATGKSLVIGTSSDIAATATEADAWQAAADSIGLKATLRNVSADNYINFFTEASARKGVDAIASTNYGNYADPAALLKTFLLPGGSQNFDNYNNPQMTQLLNAARSEASPVKRAEDMVAVERLFMQQLPWIPVAEVDVDMVVNNQFTGAPASFSFMASPWLAMMGQKG
jgi:peptide/nickel transport system substrate-binding protein